MARVYYAEEGKYRFDPYSTRVFSGDTPFDPSAVDPSPVQRYDTQDSETPLTATRRSNHNSITHQLFEQDMLPADIPQPPVYSIPIGSERLEVPFGEPTAFPIVVGQLPSNKLKAFNILCWISQITGIQVRTPKATFKGRNLVLIFVDSELERQELLSWNDRILYRDDELLIATSSAGQEQLQRMLEPPSTPAPALPKRCLSFELPNNATV
jgi:hypothetical protein